MSVEKQAKLPIERINDVAHLVPTIVLQDVCSRMMDWKTSGGQDDDAYMEQQARYVERWAKVGNERGI